MPLLACAGTLGEPDAEAETDGPLLSGPLACASAKASPVTDKNRISDCKLDLSGPDIKGALSLFSKPLQLLFTAHKLTDIRDLDAACYNTLQ